MQYSNARLNWYHNCSPPLYVLCHSFTHKLRWVGGKKLTEKWRADDLFGILISTTQVAQPNPIPNSQIPHPNPLASAPATFHAVSSKTYYAQINRGGRETERRREKADKNVEMLSMLLLLLLRLQLIYTTSGNRRLFDAQHECSRHWGGHCQWEMGAHTHTHIQTATDTSTAADTPFYSN